ncbi:MAG: hypothetical protein AB1609_19790 [Bacillota bacterium]
MDERSRVVARERRPAGTAKAGALAATVRKYARLCREVRAKFDIDTG